MTSLAMLRRSARARNEIIYWQSYNQANADFRKWANLSPLSTDSGHPQSTMPHTTLSTDDMKEMRLLLINAVQYLVTTCKDAIADKGSWNNFKDVELSVSTSVLNSSNCENLGISDLAHFVKFTEKNNDTKVEPMVIMFGVVLTKFSSMAPPPYGCRLWLDYVPKFEKGADRASNDVIPQMGMDLIDSVSRACREFKDFDFTRMEMANT